MTQRLARWAAGLLLTLVALALTLGHFLSRPVRQAMPASAFQDLALPVPGLGSVKGWLGGGKPGQGAVLLLHGVRSNRLQMLARAQALQDQGQAVMLIDLPAHGASDGSRISFGWNERLGVQAAWAEMQRRWPLERKAVIGVSLGAAAFVLADVRPRADAVVLESLYPTLREAVDNRLRLRLGALGPRLAPLLTGQLPLWIGLSADQLRPIDHLARMHAPLLLVSGSADLHTTEAETRRLFLHAAAPKSLWLVQGAAHVDLMAFDPVAYRREVLGFVRRQLLAAPALEPFACLPRTHAFAPPC